MLMVQVVLSFSIWIWLSTGYGLLPSYDSRKIFSHLKFAYVIFDWSMELLRSQINSLYDFCWFLFILLQLHQTNNMGIEPAVADTSPPFIWLGKLSIQYSGLMLDKPKSNYKEWCNIALHHQYFWEHGWQECWTWYFWALCTCQLEANSCLTNI